MSKIYIKWLLLLTMTSALKSEDSGELLRQRGLEGTNSQRRMTPFGVSQHAAMGFALSTLATSGYQEQG